MIRTITPQKLQAGDTIRIIAPALSMAIVSPETRKYAQKKLHNELGLKVTFGKNVEEKDLFNSSSIQSRLDDLHDAFRDTEVKAILTAIGGFNSNQLLSRIDWGLITNNPKIVCGYSDVTALLNAIYAKTGLVTYYGPHYSTFGQKHLDPYTPQFFVKCLSENSNYEIGPSTLWTDDQWFLDQDDRNPRTNEGHWKIRPGSAKGRIVGGNLSTLNLLQGTPYMPAEDEVILFVEDDSDSSIVIFDRMLQSLLQSHVLNIKGLVVGRFQEASKVTRELLEASIRAKPELQGVPIIANVDFGHTDPKATFPIGGAALIDAAGHITISQH